MQIAAAKIVVVAAGRPTTAAKEEEDLSEWLACVRPSVEPHLIKQALLVLDHVIGENSEFRALWEEIDEFPGWLATIVDLQANLQS